MKMGTWWMIALAGLLIASRGAAQAPDGTLSDREVEELRDASFVPMDCIAAYEMILNRREKDIEDLLAKPRHAGRETDLHDLMEQMAGIADELNDHLDDYTAKHRDVRKALPKLLQATERWSTTLRAPPENDEYKVVRKLALDTIRDMRDEVESMQTDEEAYFKAHPDAAKVEKDRLARAHDTTPN